MRPRLPGQHSHLHITLRQPSDRMARYAEAHLVKGMTVDGNDVVAVMRAARELVAFARAGHGPGFLEAITYRHRGLVGPKEDIDVGVRRSMADLRAWKKLDPIQRLTDALLGAGLTTPARLADQEREMRELVAAASARARTAPHPPLSALLDVVLTGKPA